MKTRRLVYFPGKARIVAHILHDLRCARREGPADDAGAVGNAQLVVGHAEGGASDKLLACLVPQENAGPFAAQQASGLGRDVLQERNRFTLQRQLLANVEERGEPLALCEVLIPLFRFLQRDSGVMPRGDEVFQIGAAEGFARAQR